MTKNDEKAKPQLSPEQTAPTDDFQFDYGEKQADGQYQRHPTDTTGEFVEPVRNAYRHRNCGKITSMSKKIAETYAKTPDYYSHTFCSGCGDYFPVAQFNWVENGKVIELRVGGRSS